jgi:hypothetical protein
MCFGLAKDRVADMGIRVENVESLVGVWARRSIRWADGREDTSTRVFWVQGQICYGDIRIPAVRPSFAEVESLADCGVAQREWLAKQEGFAGELVAKDGAWIWKREIDYRLPTGKRDIGRLMFVDESRRMMIEEGVDEPYVELWERIDDGSSTNGETFAARLKGAGEMGLLIAVGGHFLFAMGRSDYVEISHGERRGALADWTVADSTIPWREGTRLFDGKKPVWQIVEPVGGEPDWIY